MDDEDMEKLLIRMAKACLVVFLGVDIDAWLETWEKNIQSCNINIRSRGIRICHITVRIESNPVCSRISRTTSLISAMVTPFSQPFCIISRTRSPADEM